MKSMLAVVVVALATISSTPTLAQTDSGLVHAKATPPTWAPVPSVTLWGYAWTPLQWDGPALRYNLQTLDGNVWPVICRRPNLGICTAVAPLTFPALFYVTGYLAVPGHCTGCFLEIVPATITRIP